MEKDKNKSPSANYSDDVPEGLFISPLDDSESFRKMEAEEAKILSPLFFRHNTGNFMPIHYKDIILSLGWIALLRSDFSLHLALHGIILELICKIRSIGHDIDNRDHIDFVLALAEKILINDRLEH